MLAVRDVLSTRFLERVNLTRRRLRAVVASAVVGGWVAGIVFWVLVLPALLDLGEVGMQRLMSSTSASEGVTSGGTGFVVNSTGQVLTNAHVVDHCESITGTIGGEERALALMANDPANDLAVLKLSAPGAHFATFRDRDARLAESIIVPGFPLPGVLSSTMHVTTGLVSNLASMHDNTSSFQMSAPTQPGNSGSPVLDQAGNVVGVVAGGLDAEEMLQESGDVPQLVNFAIKTSVVRSFLESNSVEFRLAKSTVDRGTEEIAAEASLYTLPLTCRE
jgi:S1-C subfamily serine protease